MVTHCSAAPRPGAAASLVLPLFAYSLGRAAGRLRLQPGPVLHQAGLHRKYIVLQRAVRGSFRLPKALGGPKKDVKNACLGISMVVIGYPVRGGAVSQVYTLLVLLMLGWQVYGRGIQQGHPYPQYHRHQETALLNLAYVCVSLVRG